MIQKLDTRGMSVLEMIIVVTLFMIVFSTIFTFLGDLFSRHTLITKGDELVQTLREARHDSVSQKEDSSWGVYFDSSSRRYILFKGTSYSSRDTSYDRILILSEPVSFFSINTGGGSQVLFNKRSGDTINDGRIVLTNSDEIFTIEINRLGLIDYSY